MVSSAEEVIALSNALGDPSLDLAILAEGNASGRFDQESFWIKASGFSLATLTQDQLVKVSFGAFANLGGDLTDSETREILSASRVDQTPLMPSVETFMHAFLLGLPDVNFVGHTHPTPLISLLGLDIAKDLASQRIFPDEIVCCGPATAFVPYEDPGLPLARSIKESVINYMKQWERVPRTIWLANHGLIALGVTRAEVENASKMSVKCARVWLGALGSGQKIQALSRPQIERIHSRPDEHYRQRILAATVGI